MTAGRPPLPTHLKLIKGTLRKQRTNPAEPTPQAGIPEMPADLSLAARAAWKRFSALLSAMGVLTVADGCALERLCEATADLAAARAALAARDGLTYMIETRDGGITWRPYPELKLIAEADHRLGSWLAKFGLSPSDRSKVSAVAKAVPTDAYFR